MDATEIHLFKATDAGDAFAIHLRGNDPGAWLAERGFGQNYQRVWSVEAQGAGPPDLLAVDWEAVLDRVIEAYDLNDPVISNFSWPLKQMV